MTKSFGYFESIIAIIIIIITTRIVANRGYPNNIKITKVKLAIIVPMQPVFVFGNLKSPIFLISRILLYEFYKVFKQWINYKN